MATISIIGSLNWGTIGWVALATVVLVVLVAAIGRGILAAFPPRPEHMSSFKKASPAPAPAPVAAPVAPAAPAVAPTYKNIPMETLAVISAAVAVVLRGKKYTLLGVRPAPAPTPEVPQNPAANVERLMTEWSMEGRRQVYSSHDVSAFR
ncbi:MAG: hypothetical protein LUD39_02200 [Opitutae bacterium]|nr:hypothetical protein [Opitutae bacterium]